MWNKYDNYRTVRTLKEVVQLRLKFVAVPSRSERFAQPIDGEPLGIAPTGIWLYVIALVGALRYGQHRRFAKCCNSEVSIAERSVGHC